MRNRRHWLLILLGIELFLALPASHAQYTISGTVADPEIQPVSGVDVLLYTQEGDPVGGITPGLTDDNGFYTIGAGRIPAGTYQVGFEPPTSSGLVALLVPNVVVHSNITLDITLSYGNLLDGYVRDSTGTGLPDIDLNITDEITGLPLYISGDNTDEEGYYDLIVPSGRFTIIYRRVGGGRLVPVELGGVNISGDTSIDVVMSTGFFVSGLVTGPGGEPVAGADLDAEDSFSGIKIYTPGDNTDNNGHYQLLLPPGTYDINVAPDPSERLLPGIVYLFPVYHDTTLNFSLESGFLLSGTVTDPDDNGVFDVDLDIINPADGTELFTPSDNTDSSGVYNIVIPPGVFDIDYKPRAVPPYLAPFDLNDVVVSGDLVRDVTLSYGVLVSGTVHDTRNRPVSSVDIDARDTVDLDDIPLVGDFTDSSGSFATVLPIGTYDLDFNPTRSLRLAAKRLLSVSLNADTTLSVVLDTGMVVSGAVRDSAGALLADVKVTAFESNTGLQALTPGNKSDSAGNYLILLKPDLYDFLFRPDTSHGIRDSVFLESVSITHDTLINVIFRVNSGDTIGPTVNVISPNGGEVWDAFDIENIMWNADDNIGVAAIDIYYSINGPMGMFMSIAIGEANDGDYAWSIPGSPSSDVRVKVVARDAAGNFADDVSDASFTIVSPATCCGGPMGDANGSGQTNGLDVTYLVSFFKGGPPPPDTCTCSPYSGLYAKADANGNCSVNGLDVTYLVGFFKGGPGLRCCPDCPFDRILKAPARGDESDSHD
jgi:hypothetical protein